MKTWQKKELRNWFKVESWQWRDLKEHCDKQQVNIKNKAWIAYYACLEKICDKKLGLGGGK